MFEFIDSHQQKYDNQFQRVWFDTGAHVLEPVDAIEEVIASNAAGHSGAEDKALQYISFLMTSTLNSKIAVKNSPLYT